MPPRKTIKRVFKMYEGPDFVRDWLREAIKKYGLHNPLCSTSMIVGVALRPYVEYIVKEAGINSIIWCYSEDMEISISWIPYYDTYLYFPPMGMSIKQPCSKVPDIEKVIYNNPATIILWTDGTKTVVKCQENDELQDLQGSLDSFRPLYLQFEQPRGSDGSSFFSHS